MIQHLLNSFSSSLKARLLAPLAIGCLLMVIATFISLRWLGMLQAHERLKNRAETAARTITYAAETLDNTTDFQRMVNSLGGEKDITTIVAVSGSPPTVIASTNNAWIGLRLADLPQKDVGENLLEAIQTKAQNFHYHRDSREVDCTTPLLTSEFGSLLTDGAVMIRVDANPVEHGVYAWANLISLTILMVTVLAFSAVCLLAHKVVLKPIRDIIWAIEHDSPVLVSSRDEIGILGRTFTSNRNEAISFRNKLETALREINALRRALDEHSILSVADHRGRIIDVNTGFCQISGYTREELLGQDHRLLNSGTHPKEFWVNVWKTISSGQAWRGEVCNRRKSGEIYWVDSTIVPYTESNGKIEKYVSIRFDITAQKNAQSKLLEAQAAAEAANTAKSQFLANMSHEIRTPMTAILGYADLLAEQGDRTRAPHERLEHIDTIKRNGEHLLSIINDILDISKIEAGKMTVESLVVSLPQLLLDVESLMSVKAHQKQISLNIQLDTPIPEFMRTDPVRLKQIVVNLVGNAIKFTEKGSVTLRAEVLNPNSSEPSLRLSVIDSGIGMTPEQTRSLFMAFQQADASTTRKFGGTGLGLRISKTLANMLGGDITVTSTHGQGSTFTLTVTTGSLIGVKFIEPGHLRECHPSHSNSSPVQSPSFPNQPPSTSTVASAALDRGTQSENERGPLSGIRIFLAEDGIDNQRLISFHLKNAGASVRIFDNGLLALQALTSSHNSQTPLLDPTPCDLLLTDMQMPEMDGYTLARVLRSKAFSKPIIALTAHAMEGDSAKCLEAGCDAYATKPINKTRLIEVCINAIKARAMSLKAA